MISGCEEESWITLPSPPTSSPKEFKSAGAFRICLRSLSPSPPSDSRNLSEEGEALLPPLEVSCMTSVPANVLYLTCLSLYSEVYIKLHYSITAVTITAVTEGKTPVPVCSPKLNPVGRG